MNASRLAMLLLLVGTPLAFPCDLTSFRVTTLRDELAGARVVLYATATNPRPVVGGGKTDFVVHRILKSDPAIKGKAVITIDRYVNVPDPKNPPQFLLFAEVEGGKLDVYRGEIAGPAIADYLAGLLAIDGKDRVRVLKYCAGYLDHHEPSIVRDVLAEFGKSLDADVRAAGKTMDPDKLRGWLRSKDTPPALLGMYALLLAQCGNKGDAGLLRQLLDKAEEDKSPLLPDAVYAAYTTLDPLAGWAYTCEAIRDPRNDFLVRYAGLRAARYFHTTRTDVIPVADRLKAISLALRHADMADLAVDDLRKWKSWTLTGDVLALFNREGFDLPIVRRAVVRYALRCPDEAAATFVGAVRHAYPKLVADAEESLIQESRPNG